MSYEVAFAAWSCVSLLSIALGGALAKYSQAWAGETLHPGAAVGVSIVALGVAIALTAALRYLAASQGVPAPQRPSRLMFTMGVTLVLVLAWAVLAIVFFAGWQFPPARPD